MAVTDVQEQATSAMLDGRYQLHELVGEGAMAQVYRAEDVVLGRTVAVKLMRTGTDVLTSPERARTEVSVLAGLNHPALVTLLDACLVPGRTGYLVMEFVAGTTLADRMRQGPLSGAEAAHLTVALAAGLEAVHAAGVVHRDVKPSNVLLAATAQPRVPFRAKLTDFGVAYLLDGTRVTSPGTVVGTAAYLSPEQLRGDAATPAADIYALGLVLLEALTGLRAFPEASGVAAVLARLVESPRVPEELGPHWSALLTRMTDADPARRPTASEVAQIVADFPVDDGALPGVAGPVPTADAGTAPVPATAAIGAASAPRLAGHARRRSSKPIAVAAVAAAFLAIPGLVWMGVATPGAAGEAPQPPHVVVVTVPVGPGPGTADTATAGTAPVAVTPAQLTSATTQKETTTAPASTTKAPVKKGAKAQHGKPKHAGNGNKQGDEDR
jgi:tRNA A-37 threonylcarbamoyl transferase component Bud32